MTDQPSVEEARFALDFAHEAAAQGDYDLESYLAARDAYAAAIRRDTLRQVREAVEGLSRVPTPEPTHPDDKTHRATWVAGHASQMRQVLAALDRVEAGD